MKETDKNLLAILRAHEADILAEWLKEQAAIPARGNPVRDAETKSYSKDFLSALIEALGAGASDVATAGWSKVRDMLTEMSAARARQGYSPADTAMLVFSLKQPIFARLRKEFISDAQKLADHTWTATLLIDKLGLFTTEAFQKSREEVIARQQRELLELSTPVVALWDDILALPLIGTLDSSRTQVVMESLLERIVETGASLAIIDITGVPTVDTLVAQHLMKTVAAARLMGADCIISGIRPQIAQTIVHLGVDLSAVTTKASLADAFAVALARVGARVSRDGKGVA